MGIPVSQISHQRPIVKDTTFDMVNEIIIGNPVNYVQCFSFKAEYDSQF